MGATTELWQLYDEQGRALEGEGAAKSDIYGKGLLHGAAHVWIWRKNQAAAEILLQRRSSNKRTWPNLLDISAAGHVDLGEEPIVTALRETKEEIALKVSESDLKSIGVQRAYLIAPSGDIEHEFQWLYLLQLQGSGGMSIKLSEVSEVVWKSLEDFKRGTKETDGEYLPHGAAYYGAVIAAIEQELSST